MQADPVDPPTPAGDDELASAMRELDEITQVYRVLPPERWVALRLLRGVYSSNPRPSRLTKKDGVIGCVGMGILETWLLPSATLGAIGVLALFASAPPWSFVVGYIGMAGIGLALLRAVPVFRASQRHLKTGDWRRVPSAQRSSGTAT